MGHAASHKHKEQNSYPPYIIVLFAVHIRSLTFVMTEQEIMDTLEEAKQIVPDIDIPTPDPEGNRSASWKPP